MSITIGGTIELVMAKGEERRKSFSSPFTLTPALEAISDRELKDPCTVNACDFPKRANGREGSGLCVGIDRSERSSRILVDKQMGQAEDIEDIDEHTEPSGTAQAEFLLDPQIQVALRHVSPCSTRLYPNRIGVFRINIVSCRPRGRRIDCDGPIKGRSRIINIGDGR